MATAKRVKQNDFVQMVPVPSTTQHYYVTVTDGVEMSRIYSRPPVTSTFIRTKRTPQPDRIVLEMSVEEAQEVRGVLAGRGCYSVYAALDGALSPTTGTQASPAKDVAGGSALGGYNPSGLYQR